MNKEKIIEKTAEYAEEKLSGEGTGHDWWHTYRVWQTAIYIGEKENADLFIVQLAALLHDIADWKFHGGDEKAGFRVAREWLEGLGVNKKDIGCICEIVKNVSFKGAGVDTRMKTIEGMVVQDADRLDVIGAIGIARVFAYGGYKGREIYNPDLKPVKYNTFEEYKKGASTSINHFYEKLLLIKDLLNTNMAREIATKRHRFIEEFLDEFFKEWNGKDLK